jgi:hypothetical protein
MSRAIPASPFVESRARLGLFQPPIPETNTAQWRINGYRATIIIWTSEEWERLKDRPPDAQYYPCGVWCALRME